MTLLIVRGAWRHLDAQRELLLVALREKGTKELTLVCNSLGDPGATRGQMLAENNQVKKLIAAFSIRAGTPTAGAG